MLVFVINRVSQDPAQMNDKYCVADVNMLFNIMCDFFVPAPYLQ